MVTQQSTSKNTKKRSSWLQWLSIVVVVILLNFIASFLFFRIDFTKEKRYTISDAGKAYVGSLNDVVFVRVYLEGEFPAGFKRLRTATKETLDDLRAYAGGNLEYEFINPTAETDPKVREEILQQLNKKGLTPINVQVSDENGQRQQIVVPGAIVSYRGREIALPLLQSSTVANSADEVLNNSIQNLEFQILNGIKKATAIEKPRIAFSIGHGELDTFQTADLIRSLREYYSVEFIRIGYTKASDLYPYRTIITIKPRRTFLEGEKFNIDQYIMQGGRMLWMLDMTNASMDSLGDDQYMLTRSLNLNLDDQLFNYGVRINNDLIQDIQCAPIPVVTGNVGSQPQTQLFPWLFYPIFISSSQHPVAKNLDGLRAEFVSSIDSIDVSGIKKTALLQSSNYSRILNAPVRLSMQMLAVEPNPQQFVKKNIVAAMALEGSFRSNYKNRLVPKNDSVKFIADGKATRMIVVADGDIAKNYYSKSDSSAYPLGFDRFSRQTFSNKVFVLNAIDWLSDDFNIISARSKEVKLRMLDKGRIKKERLRWQVLNMVVPLVLVLISGIILNYRRKRKYAA